MSAPVPSPIVRATCRIAARLIQVFAFYVIFHGHYSPGGGFQGGALLAAAVILIRIAEGREGSQREFPTGWALPLGAIGVMIFAGIGLIDLLGGGNFLQYEYTPLPGLTPSQLHYWGILLVEIGVGLAVMAILVGIFDLLMERGRHG
jgi:multicomponent Na+:H+ antiporter subunit B